MGAPISGAVLSIAFSAFFSNTDWRRCVALTLLRGTRFPICAPACPPILQTHSAAPPSRHPTLRYTLKKQQHINQSSVCGTDIASVSRDNINSKRLTSSLSVIYQTNETQIIKPVILKATRGSVSPISWAGEVFAALSHQMRH